MGSDGEWQEKCSLCGRKVGRTESPAVFRLMEDHWSYCETWDELLMICQECFARHVFVSLFLRKACDAKTLSKTQ